MYTSLPCAINLVYGTNENINLIKGQRCGYVQGYRTLSDLLVGDNHFEQLQYPLGMYDQIYKDNNPWGYYIPTLQDQLTIYTLCKQWFKKGPLPILSSTDTTVIDKLNILSTTTYTKACVAACGALRLLCSREVIEIELLCENILLFIGTTLRNDIKHFPLDEKDHVRILRKDELLKKLNK